MWTIQRSKRVFFMTAPLIMLVTAGVVHEIATRDRSSEHSVLMPVERTAATVWLSSHKQLLYPPLPEQEFNVGAGDASIRQLYYFAADHPEVLAYVPCYCGCERQGHTSNEDCFVAQRDANGDVSSWDTHGMT